MTDEIDEANGGVCLCGHVGADHIANAGPAAPAGVRRCENGECRCFGFVATRPITVRVDEKTHAYLSVLARSVMFGRTGTVGDVLRHLANSAADGVRRPGAWECGWVLQAFGDDWIEGTEVIPDLPYTNLRPKQRGADGE